MMSTKTEVDRSPKESEDPTERISADVELGALPKEPTDTTTAATSSQPHTTLKSKAWHHALATDILDKQYRLYSWNDAKSLSLITTNSVLLAAIGFLFKECIPDAFSLLAITFALIFVALSLFFSLRQVVPQGSSGKSGSGPNVRALRSITRFKDWESYHTKLLEMDEEESFECAARQIYGMAINNDDSRKTTTRGVRLTLVGILFILLSTFGVALSARNIHPLGRWTTLEQEARQKVESAPIKIDKPTDGYENGTSDPASMAQPTDSPNAPPSPSR